MGGFCPGAFVQGDFVRGILSRGILSRGFCPGGFCPGDFVLEPKRTSSQTLSLPDVILTYFLLLPLPDLATRLKSITRLKIESDLPILRSKQLELP